MRPTGRRGYPAAARRVPPQETAFEKKLSDKTLRTNAKNEAEIVMFDHMVTVYRNCGDVWFYIVGHQARRHRRIYRRQHPRTRPCLPPHARKKPAEALAPNPHPARTQPARTPHPSPSPRLLPPSPQSENELILVSALSALVEALTSALRTSPDKRPPNPPRAPNRAPPASWDPFRGVEGWDQSIAG